MNKGFTLQEMLIALVILGLVMGGLAALLHVYAGGVAGIGRDSAYVAASRRAQTILARMTDAMTPARAGGSDKATIDGSPQSIVFSCLARDGARAACRLRIVSAGDRVRLESMGFNGGRAVILPIRSPDAARFRFLDTAGALASRWSPRTEPRRLAGILLELRIGERWRAAAFEETLIDAAPDCQFDPVSMSCRGTP